MRNRHNGSKKQRDHVPVDRSSGKEADEVSSKTNGGRSNLRRCWILLHVIACALLAEGLRRNCTLLYTSDECIMTYSRRQFLPLLTEDHHPKYGLFKFMDARDPRHRTYLQQQMLAAKKNETFEPDIDIDTGWCTLPNVATVLYVPGHFGSFEQSRSLGAHGVQLTEQFGGNAKERGLVQRLQQLTQNQAVNDIDDDDMDWFYYDVFAIDFQEEGGAFHGSLLERQAAYIRDVVLQLTERCTDTKRIHVVAHSIGGMSARLALHEYPVLRQYVKDIITVGTPHRFPVWTWDVSLWNVYAAIGGLSGGDDSVAVYSISGGLRDAMIPAEACGAGTNIVSVLALHHLRDNSLGMDHKAIVWCAGVLERVRSVLFATRKDDTVPAILSKLRELTPGEGTAANYGTSCEDQLGRMKMLYSYLGGTLMEAGLLHNAEHFVFLFATIGSLRYLTIPSFVAAPVTMGLLLLRVYLSGERSYSIPAVLLLVLAAHALYATVHTAVRLVSSTRRRPFTTKRLALASLVISVVVSAVLWHESEPQTVTSVSVGTIFMTTFAFLLLLLKGALQRFNTNDKLQERQLALTALAIALVPLLILGELVALTEGLATSKTVFTLIPICLRFAMAGSVLQLRSRQRTRWWRIVDVARWSLLGFYVTTFVAYTVPTSTRLFHPMAVLIMGLAMVDAVEQSLVWL